MTAASGGSRRPWRALVGGFLGVLLAIAIVAYLRECIEEAPRVAYELGEYAGVTPGDLGTERLFDDPATLKLRLTARRPGRVRFLVAGDGGLDDDPGKRALARSMRQLCDHAPCDFVLFTGDNVYQEGIDTFGAVERALADSIAGFDLHEAFLDSLSGSAASSLGVRVRAAAGRVSRACAGRVAAAGAAGRADGADAGGGGGATDEAGVAGEAVEADAAGAAFRRHFEPKFERTFGWLAERRIPAFLVLGNHDLRKAFGAECEIGYSSLAPRTAWRMPFYFYQVEVADPAGGRPLATLFALESAPPHADPAGENHARIGPRQRAWLHSALAGSQARWNLAASHDPLWSAGPHVLTEYLSFHRDLPAVAREAGARLDVLLAGHNHWLESAQVKLNGEPALQVVSGALSKAALPQMLLRGYPFFNALALNGAWRRELAQALGTDPRAFLAADHSVLRRGFAVVDLTADAARVQFYGVDGPFYGETLVRDASASRSARPMGIAGSTPASNQRNGAPMRRGGGVTGEQTSGVRTSRKWE